jgi:hypothetical protein
MNTGVDPRDSGFVTRDSQTTLLRAAAIAFMVALLVLVAIVLPAEYGIDPLGTGRATGLINLAQATAPPIVASASGPIRTQAADYKTDERQFTLEPYGGYVEYKYQLAAGATMLYRWTATGEVNFDMHTEPAGRPPSASESFERGATREGRGSYVAPYDGIHGWFFENTGEEPVTVTVTTVGFYTAAKEFRDDGTTVDYPVKDGSAANASR